MTEDSNTHSRVRPPRIMPPVYLLAGIIAMAALHWLLPGSVVLAAPWRWLGAVLVVGGLLFGLAAIRLFAKYKTTIKPGETSSHLMTDGPFRVSRNPIYVGMTLILAGIAMMLGSATPWLVLPVFVALIARNVIPVEETMMAEAFGAQYDQYRTRVRRWI